MSLFAAGVGSYQTSQCEQANYHNAHPPSLQQPSPLPQHGNNGQQQVGEHGKHPPYFGCGWTGIPASVVGFMDSHEGFFVGGFTFALFFATILLWLAGERQMELIAANSVQQSREMQASIAAARDSADAAMAAVGSERAWITLTKVDIAHIHRGVLENGETFVEGLAAIVNWQNTGRSPAIKVAAATDYRIVDINETVPPVFGDIIAARGAEDNGTIGPQVPVTIPTGGIGDALRSEILSRRKVYVIYSVVRYRDVYRSNLERVSEACIRIEYMGVGGANPDGPIKWKIQAFGPQNTIS